MGLSSLTNRASFVGDGTSTIFSFPYYFFSPSDLNVYLYDTGSSIVYPQVLNTNYSVSGSPTTQGVYPSGGNVVMTSAFPSALQLIVVRNPSPVQNYVLLQNGQINSLALVQQFDYLTALVQRLQDEVSRSVQLPDGAGTVGGVNFNTTLPASMLLGSSQYQVLTINSGASGWQFSVVPGIGSIIPVIQGGTGAASPLVPGGVVYGVSSSVMTTGAQGTAGQALLSGGAGAPSWGSISIGSGSVSAGSIQGILGLYQGGTNTGSSYNYPVSSIIIASGVAAQQGFAGIGGGSGLPLVSQGSNAPVYQALALSGSGITGILGQGNGGTGSVFFPNPGGVMYGSGVLTVFSSTSAGGTDQPLVGNTGGAPAFGPINLASGSSVTGTLAIGKGGTGQTSQATAFNGLSPTNTQGDITWFLGSSNVRLPAGATNTVLTMTANSTVSWASPSGGSTLSVSTKSAAYNATTSDDVLLAASGCALINLYGVSGNSGRTIRVKKTVNSFDQVLVAGSSASIDGSSVLLSTFNESVELICDGTNWNLTNRRIEQSWQSYSPAVAAFGTVTANNFQWRRNCGNLDIRGRFTAGLVTGGQAQVPFPTGVPNSNILNALEVSGMMAVNSNASATYQIVMLSQQNQNFFTFGLQNTGNSALMNNGIAGNVATVNSNIVSIIASVPIQGWQG